MDKETFEKKAHDDMLQERLGKLTDRQKESLWTSIAKKHQTLLYDGQLGFIWAQSWPEVTIMYISKGKDNKVKIDILTRIDIITADFTPDSIVLEDGKKIMFIPNGHVSIGDYVGRSVNEGER